MVEAADGTPITFHTHGESGGPVVVLTNGIGTTENFWRAIIEELVVDHTVVHWDYRGHGLSPVSKSNDYSLRTQADDLARVTRRVMVDGKAPVHIAFSMGVAVLLELYRAEPHFVKAMALVAGAPDAPGTGTWLFKLPGSLAAARALTALTTPVVPLFAPAVKALLRSKFPYPMARFMGVLQPHAPRADIDEFLSGIADMDLVAYWRTLQGLLTAKGSDVLPQVKVPVAIIAAAKDLLMPLTQVEAMRRGLPHATYTRVEDAGHAGLVEKGSEMARAVRDLIRRLPA